MSFNLRSSPKKVSTDENGNMSKTIFADTRLEAYRSFFDHAWAKQIMDLAHGTKLDQPVFDLCAAWRGAANTHLLPWLLATQVQSAIEMRVSTSSRLAKSGCPVVRDKLVAAMGDSLRHMQRRKLQEELEKLFEEVNAINQEAVVSDGEEMWQEFFKNPEFQFALLGSQRMCYAAVYYAYEDFLARCVGLARCEPDYRMPRRGEFQKHFAAVLGEPLCDLCWTNAKVNLARVTRHALVHTAVGSRTS